MTQTGFQIFKDSKLIKDLGFIDPQEARDQFYEIVDAGKIDDQFTMKLDGEPQFNMVGYTGRHYYKVQIQQLSYALDLPTQTLEWETIYPYKSYKTIGGAKRALQREFKSMGIENNQEQKDAYRIKENSESCVWYTNDKI